MRGKTHKNSFLTSKLRKEMNKITGITMAMGVLAVVSCGTKQGTGSLIGAGGGAIVLIVAAVVYVIKHRKKAK